MGSQKVRHNSASQQQQLYTKNCANWFKTSRLFITTKEDFILMFLLFLFQIDRIFSNTVRRTFFLRLIECKLQAWHFIGPKTVYMYLLKMRTTMVVQSSNHVQLLQLNGLLLPGSSVPRGEISQARILEWAVLCFSRASVQPKDWICVSCTAGGFFTIEPPGKPKDTIQLPKSRIWLIWY